MFTWYQRPGVCHVHLNIAKSNPVDENRTPTEHEVLIKNTEMTRGGLDPLMQLDNELWTCPMRIPDPHDRLIQSSDRIGQYHSIQDRQQRCRLVSFCNRPSDTLVPWKGNDPAVAKDTHLVQPLTMVSHRRPQFWSAPKVPLLVSCPPGESVGLVLGERQRLTGCSIASCGKPRREWRNECESTIDEDIFGVHLSPEQEESLMAD